MEASRAEPPFMAVLPVPFAASDPTRLCSGFRSPREATQDRPLHAGSQQNRIRRRRRKEKTWGTIVRALLVTGLWLCLCLRGPLQQWGEGHRSHRKTTSFDPATLKQERRRSCTRSWDSDQRYAHQVSRSLSSALEQRPPRSPRPGPRIPSIASIEQG